MCHILVALLILGDAYYYCSVSVCGCMYKHCLQNVVYTIKFVFRFWFQERTKNAQFIIISLRNNMFELADRLVGIYKTDNCTKSVTINPHKLRVGTPPTATPTTVVSADA